MKKPAREIVSEKKNDRLWEWERQIKEQKSSGLNVKEWCRKNDISISKFYYRSRKIRMLNMPERETEISCDEATDISYDAPSIVPLVFDTPNGNILLEKNGLKVFLPENISAEILLELVSRLC